MVAIFFWAVSESSLYSFHEVNHLYTSKWFKISCYTISLPNQGQVGIKPHSPVMPWGSLAPGQSSIWYSKASSGTSDRLAVHGVICWDCRLLCQCHSRQNYGITPDQNDSRTEQLIPRALDLQRGPTLQRTSRGQLV